MAEFKALALTPSEDYEPLPPLRGISQFGVTKQTGPWKVGETTLQPGSVKLYLLSIQYTHLL